MADASRPPVCAVVGVGPGNGAAFVRRFADEGYLVAMIARSGDVMANLAAEIAASRPYMADVSDAGSLENAFGKIEDELGPVDVLVYNAGKGVWGSAEEVSAADFEACWRVNALGAFIAARCVIAGMKAKGSGNIIFIGATASRRGGAKTAAFASAKAAQRSLAESLARALGPVGVHVSSVIVDGIIDEPVARARMAGKPDDFFLQPADLADTLVMLTRQKRSAWTFELEVRPFKETW